MKQLINLSLLRVLVSLLFISIACLSQAQAPFITTWKTDNNGGTCNSCIEIPTTGTSLNYDVDWDNDGVFDQFGITGNVEHDFGTAGTYTIQIRGDFQIHFGSTSSPKDYYKILSVDQWGDIEWQSMELAFFNCKNLTITSSDAPNLSNVTSLNRMFKWTRKLTGNFSTWDVSTITDMHEMFANTDDFNSDLSNWNVSNVTDMAQMFYGASSFNSDISNWDVSNVTDMAQMFRGASSFNSDINNWDVSNGPNTYGMFNNAQDFNRDLNNWDVSGFLRLDWMFSGASSFNGDISNWDISHGPSIQGMFYSASSFNGDISNWDVSNVTDMGQMFRDASSFNGDISSWDVSNVEEMRNIFDFSGLDINNYDNILNSWSTLNLQSDIELGSLTLGYCLAENSRNRLIDDFNWTIIGDAKVCSPAPHDPFITTWKTDNTGTSCNSCITIPAGNTGFYFDVDWNNDGVFDEFGLNSGFEHDFGSPGIYTIQIQGYFPFIELGGDKDKLISVDQWGGIQWEIMEETFKDCLNLSFSATDIPDLSQVSSLGNLFQGAENFNGDISNWDVSTITNMSAMFSGAKNFEGNLNNWDVSNVTDMSAMFSGAVNFDKNLNNWDVSNVTQMHAMFQNATSFNSDISTWNVTNVIHMHDMFQSAINFTSDISNWDVSNVTQMHRMFNYARQFNSDISNWDVSNVSYMHDMFQSAYNFNSDISNWDVSSVTNMSNMLNDCGLSISNYDALLNTWSNLNLNQNIYLGSRFLSYCDGELGRNKLINDFNWYISSDTKLCPTEISEIEQNNCYAGNSSIEISWSQGNLNEWVSFYDNVGEIICSIHARYNTLGQVSVNVYKSSTARTANIPYMDRDIEIKVTDIPSSPVRVRLYYKEQEFINLQSADPTIQSLNDLAIIKTDDPCNGIYAGIGESPSIKSTNIFNSNNDFYIDIDVASFSNFHALNKVNGITLPSDLGNLSAIQKNNSVQLNWNTFQEVNNEGFEIQKMSEQNEWSEIGFITGMGQSTTEVEYSFIDRNPVSGINYYRLKQIDFNGAFHYSDIVSVDYKSEESDDLHIYPNPVSENLYLDIENDVEFTIYNKLSQRVKSGTCTSKSIPVSELQSGIYILQILHYGKLKYAKFSKI